MVGRLNQGSLDKTAVIGESGHDGRDRLVWAGQSGQDREDRLARTRIGQLGKIKKFNRDKETMAGQPGQDNRGQGNRGIWDTTTGTEQSEQGSQDRTVTKG
jgi:hypothetical protein